MRKFVETLKVKELELQRLRQDLRLPEGNSSQVLSTDFRKLDQVMKEEDVVVIITPTQSIAPAIVAPSKPATTPTPVTKWNLNPTYRRKD